MNDRSRMRSLLSGLMAALLLVMTSLTMPAAAAPAHENIEVAYNDFRVNLQGQQLDMQDANGSAVKPFSFNGTIYLPLRAIAESLGLEASYDGDTHVVSLTGTVSTTDLASSSNENSGQQPPTGDQTNGTPPEPPTGDQNSGTPPEPPTGDQTNGTPPEPPTGDQTNGTPPEPPAGDQTNGTPPELPTGDQNGVQPPDGTTPGGPLPGDQESGPDSTTGQDNSGSPAYEQIEVDYNDITVVLNGATLELTDANGNAVYPFSYNGTIYLPVRAISQALGLTVAYDSGSRTVNMNRPDGNSGNNTVNPGTDGTSTVTGSGVYELNGEEASKTSESIVATESDQSCIKVTDGGVLDISNSNLSKTGDTSSEEASDFNGLNAAVLAESASTINLNGCTINTDAAGSNGVFATGEGTAIYIADSSIVTTQNSSRGLDATYNGSVTAVNVNITTAGDHCAALATDRGEGTIDVTGGTMQTAGEGSPGIYSTGTIKVKDADISATGSEAAVVEGKNSISLMDTDISGAVKCGVMMYQSFSGDADVGTSEFSMTGGSLTAAAGPLFYCTNTRTSIELYGVDLNNGSDTLLSAAADRWGTTGSNGAQVSFLADSQSLLGDVLCDSISTVALTLQNSSVLEGTVNNSNSAQSVSLSLDSGSKWVVTADSYLTVLQDGDESLGNIDDNGFTIYYDSADSGNDWLNGATITLTDGGQLVPME